METKIAKAATMVGDIRKRLEKLDIKFGTVGQWKGQIFIFLEDMRDSERVKKYLLEDEKEIVNFLKA